MLPNMEYNYKQDALSDLNVQRALTRRTHRVRATRTAPHAAGAHKRASHCRVGERARRRVLAEAHTWPGRMHRVGGHAGHARARRAQAHAGDCRLLTPLLPLPVEAECQCRGS